MGAGAAAPGTAAAAFSIRRWSADLQPGVGDLGIPRQRILRSSSNYISEDLFNHEIEHLSLIFRRAMAIRDFAAGYRSAHTADTTEAGSRRRVFGCYTVHLHRNRPCDGRRWPCIGESGFRGPAYSLSKACDIMVVSWLKRDVMKTDACLVTRVLQL